MEPVADISRNAISIFGEISVFKMKIASWSESGGGHPLAVDTAEQSIQSARAGGGVEPTALV